MDGLEIKNFNDKTAEYEEAVDFFLKNFDEETRDRAKDLFKEYGAWLNGRDLQKKLDEITGGGVESCLVTHRASINKVLKDYKSLGIEFYKWSSCDCPAKGHTEMDGAVCRIDEPKTVYENDGNGEPMGKPRRNGAAVGTPADCEEFCRCSVSMFEPEIDW